MIDTLKTAYLLCSLKNRLIYNHLRHKADFGKIIGFLLIIVACVFAVSDFFSDVSAKIIVLPFGEPISLIVFSLILFFLLFITLTGDLTSGYTINMGQMSTDFEFLQLLPVKPLSILLLKLYERVINDYFGILIMLSSFIGIFCRDGFGIPQLCYSLVLFFHFSLFIGLSINLLMIVLTRICKKSTINNLFSIIGYISAFTILVPVVLLEGHPQELINFFLKLPAKADAILSTLLLPFIWIAECLLAKTLTFSYLKFFLFWALIMLLGGYCYSFALKKAWYSHKIPDKSVASKKWLPNYLSGIFCKELALLKSDLSLFVNSLLLPLTIIIFEIYMMKTVFAFKTVPSILNLLFGTIIYFAMFGPINAIGNEGKSITMLETLPISPQNLIFQKYLAWLAIAELFFVPITFAGFVYMRFTVAVALQSSIIVSIFVALCVFMAICISAVYANYEAKVLFQRSTFLAKLVCLAFMLVLIPVKYVSFNNFLSLFLFLLLLCITWFKAVYILQNRLEYASVNSKFIETLHYAYIVIFYFAVVVTLHHFVNFIVPGLYVGHWPWTLALFASTAFATITLKPKL